jgi:signal transduction histidine kinase/ligand-binding sensor domain-containing protein
MVTIHKFYFILIIFLSLITGFHCNTKEKERKSPSLNITQISPVQTKEILLENLPILTPVKKDISLIKNTTVKVLKDKSTGLPLSPESHGNGFYTTYNTENGLSLDDVFCSYNDSKGNLWFGTLGGGVSKYDGKYFTNFTKQHGLAGNSVLSITELKSGDILFSTTDGGVSRYDGFNFQNYTTKEGLSSNFIWNTHEDKYGNIWFATEGFGADKFDGKTFKNYSIKNGLHNNFIKTIASDSFGNVWIGSKINGISVFDGTEFIRYPAQNNLPSDKISSCFLDSRQNMWFGTVDKGIFKIDVSKNIKNHEPKFKEYSSTDGFTQINVLDITEDRLGNIWFASKENGVVKYSEKNESKGITPFIKYDHENGLPYNSIYTITEDTYHNIWMGTYGQGVFKYYVHNILSYNLHSGHDESKTRGIAEDKEKGLWFLYENELNYFDGIETICYTFTDEFNHNIHSIFIDKKNNVWLGSIFGLIKFTGKKSTLYSIQKENEFFLVNYIFDDNQGNIIFSAWGHGLCILKNETIVNLTTKDGLAGNQIRSIYNDSQNNIWLGYEGSGVSMIKENQITNFSKNHGLGDETVFDIDEDKYGNVFFATTNGLSVVNVNSIEENIHKNIAPFNNYTTKNGLFNNYITNISGSESDTIIIGTSSGISVLPGGFQDFIKNKNIKHYNLSTGFPIKNVVIGQNSLFRDKNGIIWICTGSEKSGLLSFNYPDLSNISPISELFIKQIFLNGEKVSWTNLKASKDENTLNYASSQIIEELNVFGNFLSEEEKIFHINKFKSIQFSDLHKETYLPSNLILPFLFNNITFDFQAIETFNNPYVVYQYKLEGYDKDWSQVSKSSSASFGNMNEGNYTFKIRAKNESGVWSPEINYSFRVLPPWWRSWWAYLIYAFLLSLVLYFFHGYQKRRLLSIETQKRLKTELEQAKEIETAYEKLKTAQVQLVHAEKMASLGELTAGIAHEIQNPLNFVNNFSEVNCELLEELREEIVSGKTEGALDLINDLEVNQEKIKFHGKRADAIVKGMLYHSRSSSGVKEPTDINALADECMRLSFHGLRAKDKQFSSKMEIHLDESIGKINVVSQDIGRVFLNIITNAFYAVNEKAKLRQNLNTSDSEYEPMVSLFTAKKNNMVEVILKDNGEGIPASAMDKIFKPFFTTKPTGQGTGLGLSLSHDIIVKGHDGTIQVNTKEGEGTEFIITLPII